MQGGVAAVCGLRATPRKLHVEVVSAVLVCCQQVSYMSHSLALLLVTVAGAAVQTPLKKRV
jgi:hypothetical protein